MKQDHPDLSVRRRCSLFSLARSSLYYHPRGESAENLAFMEIIDRQFLETPWYRSRQMARHMPREGIGAWIACYNEKRPHSSHGLLTQGEAYDSRAPNLKDAA